MDCDRCENKGCRVDRIVIEDINRFVDNWPFNYITTEDIIAAKNALLKNCPDSKPSPPPNPEEQ